MRTVADLMSSPAVTAVAGESLAAAAERMRHAGVGSVVVVDGARPVGILTERDLVRATAAGADVSTAAVGAWMTPDPDCVGTDVEVAEAWRSLAAHGYRHIPVVVSGEVKGVVSMRDLMGVAQLRPVDGSFTDAPRGLKGVVVAETALGDVRGLEGFYHYRQYSAVEISERLQFEDAWQLLIDGHLPDQSERDAFAAEVRELRRLPASISAVLPAVAAASDPAAGPLAGMRTAVSLLGAAEGFRPSLDVDRSVLRANALRVCAVVPTMIAALHRLAHGLDPLEPRDDLGHVANYLYMLFGEEPDARRARAIEQYMTSTIDHGFNASTFTARVTTSTGADLVSAVVAAIGSLSGPLHGGAPSRALDTLDAIGSPERTNGWVRDAVANGQRIMGFGHPVYKTYDPRSAMLRDIARSFGGERVEFAEKVEAAVLRTLAELKPDQQLHTNVEFYAGIVMELCGLPRSLFTPTFAASRTIGWCAQILEQAADNRIIRPSARYVGPKSRPVSDVPGASEVLDRAV
ncbi:MAG TPA: citrate synthase [Acidimicrobiales bacterium]|nr:citrate synthase [Acidimicrobiales bacterium]